MKLTKTYLGFAIKKKSVAIGVDNIVKTKHQIYAILYSSDLSEKSKQKLFNKVKAVKMKEIPDIDFQEITSSKSIKVIAVLDRSLSDAIINNLEVNGGW